MNTAKHVLINAVFAALVSKSLLGFVDPRFFWTIVLVGGLVDLDHLIPSIYDGMIKHPVAMIRFWAGKVNVHLRRLYLFHTYEFVLLMILLGIVFDKPIFLFISIGIVLHLIADAVTNTRFIKGVSWVPHYSLLCIVFFKK